MPNSQCPIPNSQCRMPNAQSLTKNPIFMQLIIITAADANYFELVRGTILSVRQKPESENVAIGFFDLGCTPDQLQWLETQVNFIQKPDWDFDFPGRNEAPHYLKGLLARPFLRQYFPNFDIYLWIDADAWLQDWKAVRLLVQGAAKRGLAVVPELDRGYYLAYGKLPWYSEFVYRDYQAAFGEKVAQELHSYPTINAGVFALHKDALHWELWAEYLAQGLQQHVSLMTDQIALNRLVYGTELFEKTEMLPAWCNWSCNFGLPVWDKQRGCFVEPYLPQEAIGILHMTGHKHDLVKLATTDGDTIEISLRYQPIQEQKMTVPAQSEITNNTLLPPGDYISPGFKIILPDAYFPNMIVSDTQTCPWPYLRREIPHNWYVDRRAPSVGFLSRDEAHILYNTARQFQGKKALEIGCWLGWSACHLALAGVALDVIDPLLERDDIRQSVIDSIQGALDASGVQTTVELIPGYSPQRVEEFAAQFNRKWSLIFIDGEHEGDGPLNDAIVCDKFAEKDAIILFHDLTAPDVAKGLDYLKQRGWHTIIYQTMQIMGAAWRGNVEPVKHQPDPNISWELPAHLQGYNISNNEYLNTDLNQLAIVHPNIFFSSLQAARNSTQNARSNHPESVKQVTASPQLESQPLISVIIPCYNQSHFLSQAVTSVINQTYKNWEIIIVNDGSLDTTSTVAKKLIAANPQYQIRLVEQANQGISMARNTGTAAAKGEYIMPLDADDILAANALICLLEICLKSKIPCVAFGSYQLFGTENRTVPSYDLYSPENIKQSNMIHPSSLYHKSVLDLVRGYKSEMKEGYEDWEFWVNCHKHSIPFLGTREVVVNYRRAHGSRNEKAQQYHHKLVAQIVSYNPELYDIESVNSANKLLESIAN
ncbi:MAG: glycosyltransferase [Microcoleus sp.]